MGMIVDTNVFIRFERIGKPIDFSPWEISQKVYVSVVVVSELLMGVHRESRKNAVQRRAAFVESVISGVGVLDFNLPVARIHAEICAELAKKGQTICVTIRSLQPRLLTMTFRY